MRRRIVVFQAVAVVVVLLGACSGRNAGAVSTPSPSDTSKGMHDDTVELPYEVHATGAMAASFKGTLPVRIMRVTPQSGTDTRLLSVGPAWPVPTGSRHVRVAFDLLGYEHDGDYELPAGSLYDANQASTSGTPPNLSSVLLQVWGADPNGPAENVFERRVVDCKITVGNGGRSGSVSCPQLRDTSGAEVAVTMRWG